MHEEQNHLYQRMAKVINHLVDNAKQQPTLSDLATVANMSSAHFQRTFQEWAGLSPKQFLLAVNRHHSRSLLHDCSVAETSATIGYSSESRLYDNYIRFEAVTPGEFKSAGHGHTINYGVSLSPFGEAFIAWTNRGTIKLAFLHDQLNFNAAVEELACEWPNAHYVHSDIEAEQQCARIFTSLAERRSAEINRKNGGLKIWVKGTVFQVKVWEALLAIPEGSVWSYQALSDYLGMENSVRAVASAVAKNPVGYLIPCHRVIRASGAINQYRWGVDRKAAMLILEKGTAQSASPK
jgi:AraC family transcriptional regulator of adaptative response/methylated-DNA-[protein]-cysteine methyltransferase